MADKTTIHYSADFQTQKGRKRRCTSDWGACNPINLMTPTPDKNKDHGYDQGEGSGPRFDNSIRSIRCETIQGGNKNDKLELFFFSIANTSKINYHDIY